MAEFDDLEVLKEPLARLHLVEEAAVKAFGSGDLDQALCLRMTALALAKLCLSDPGSCNAEGPECIMTKAHLQLSGTYLEMGFGDQAFWHAQKAMEQCDPRKGGESSKELLVTALLANAKAMILRGDGNCYNYLQKALQINHALVGEADRSNAPMHDALADLYIFLGDCKKQASQNYIAVSANNAKGMGVEDLAGEPLVGDENSDYEKATEELQKAWELMDNGHIEDAIEASNIDTGLAPKPELDPSVLRGKNNGPESGYLGSTHPDMGPIYTKMAKTRVKQGKLEEGTIILDKAIESYKSAPSGNHAAIAYLNYELGVTFHRLKKYEESMKELNKAAKFCDDNKIQGKYDGLALQVMKQQAICLYEVNEFKGAKKMFETLMENQKLVFGAHSISVAETMKYLGDVNVAMQHMEEACTQYNRALRILRRRLGSKNETVKQLVRYVKQLNFVIPSKEADICIPETLFVRVANYQSENATMIRSC